MMALKTVCSVVLVIILSSFSVSFFQKGMVAQVQSAAPGSPHELNPEQLKEAGLHLPSYMSLNDLNQYQEKLPQGQKLTVEWDSLPQQTHTLKKEDADQMQVEPNFTLLGRKVLPSSGGKTTLTLSEYEIVVVAVTRKGEVRGIRIQGDSRMQRAESMVHGQQQERHHFVFPKVVFTVVLPDDPEVQKIEFLKPQFMLNAGTWHLKKVGEISLPASNSVRQ